MIIIKFIFKIIEFFADKLGYLITIKKIKSNINVEIIDKNTWTPYLNKNKKLKLYFETIYKSKSNHSDSFYKQLRFYSLFNIVENILKKKNYANFAECGCWKGHSSLGILKMMEEYNFKKKFFIFDSFEGGLSDKNDKDINPKRYIQNNKEILNQKNYFKSSFEDVNKLVENFNYAIINKGWIPEVFKIVKDEKFSFVQIDVDLYQPTYDSIEFFFNRLENGGVIICDDYNCSDFPGAKLAIDKYLKNVKVNFFYEIPLGGCVIIK